MITLTENMKTIKERFEELKKAEFHYYDENYDENYDYNKIIEHGPELFVQSYFQDGEKEGLLANTIFMQPFENPLDRKRAEHVVNTYFLGLYLMKEMPCLKPSSGFFEKNTNYLWAWFLCALYHDAFFENESNNPGFECFCGYASFSQGFLWDPKTLKNYYKKNSNTKTSYDGDNHFNHGILAAEKLYQTYLSYVIDALQQDSYSKFHSPGGIGQNKKVSYDSFCAVCKIAKIIASHAIFLCEKNDEDNIVKYKNAHLSHLIDKDNKCKKPKAKFLNDDYNKLFVLLSIVDTIEPTKRDITLDKITAESDEKTLKLEIKNDNDKKKINNWLDNIEKLPSWLNFVKVKRDGLQISITVDTKMNSSPKTDNQEDA